MKNIKCIKNCDLSHYSTFKIGGKTRCAWFPQSEQEFILLLKNIENPIAIGSGSNILFSSDFIDKDIIITSNLDKYNIDNNILTVEAGVKGAQIAQVLVEKGLSGLEFLIGFPARFGGAIAQNASAQGQKISDTFINAKVFNLDTKELKIIEKTDMEFDYRFSRLKKYNEFLISANFELQKSTKELVQKRINGNIEFRKSHQPMLNLPNIGSIFKNPEGYSAGKLLDVCGFKGEKENDAIVWQNHANFILNSGNASSIDVLRLMTKMKKVVIDKLGINLKPEIIFIEGKNEEEVELWKFLKK